MGMTSGGGRGISGATSDINVTPMADIMLVLLIIFMITTPLLQEGIQVNRAKARNALEAPEIEAEDATTVTVTRERIVYVNSRAVVEDQLVDAIAEAVARAPEKPLFVKSDVAAPYGLVVTVVDRAREAGVERIGLMVDRESEGGQ
jgi:biopolymer transport protein TolR